MKCPECVREGKKSKVYVESGGYYDEDGTYHVTDLLNEENHFHCSNGHRWSIKRGKA